MEDNVSIDLFEAELTEEGQASLLALSQWGYINAIVGFISLGINLVILIIGLGKIADPRAAGSLLGTLITLVLSLILNLTLLAATQNLKKSVEEADQEMLILGLSKLSKYFKILGVLTIVILVIGALAILISLFAMASRGFN